MSDNRSSVCLELADSVDDRRMLLVVVACCAGAMTALIRGVRSAAVNNHLLTAIRAPHCPSSVGTAWGRSGDGVGTQWGRRGDDVGTMILPLTRCGRVSSSWLVYQAVRPWPPSVSEGTVAPTGTCGLVPAPIRCENDG